MSQTNFFSKTTKAFLAGLGTAGLLWLARHGGHDLGRLGITGGGVALAYLLLRGRHRVTPGLNVEFNIVNIQGEGATPTVVELFSFLVRMLVHAAYSYALFYFSCNLGPPAGH